MVNSDCISVAVAIVHGDFIDGRCGEPRDPALHAPAPFVRSTVQSDALRGAQNNDNAKDHLVCIRHPSRRLRCSNGSVTIQLRKDGFDSIHDVKQKICDAAGGLLKPEMLWLVRWWGARGER